MENGKIGMPYIRSLDGVRFIAITWVFLFHLQQYFRLSDHGLIGFIEARGWMGVDLFFVLSGFLITSILLREHSATGRISLRKFYMRRALRIWPVYYLLIAITVVGTLIAVSAGDHSRSIEINLSTIKWPAMYLTDMYAAYGNTERCALLHSWSLAIEEQFYLLWPLVLCLNLKWAKRIALIAVASIAAWRTWLTYHLPVGVIAMRRTYYAPDTRMDQLLYGAILAFILCDPKYAAAFGRLIRKLSVQLAFVSLFLLSLYINTRWSGHLGNAIGYSMDAIAMAAGIGYIIVVRPRWILASLEWRPVVYIGRVSYAMYLFSPLVLTGIYTLFSNRASRLDDVIAGVVTYGLSVAVASLSYRFFESPFLRLKERFSAQVSARAPLAAPQA